MWREESSASPTSLWQTSTSEMTTESITELLYSLQLFCWWILGEAGRVHSRGNPIVQGKLCRRTPKAAMLHHADAWEGPGLSITSSCLQQAPLFSKASQTTVTVLRSNTDLQAETSHDPHYDVWQELGRPRGKYKLGLRGKHSKCTVRSGWKKTVHIPSRSSGRYALLPQAVSFQHPKKVVSPSGHVLLVLTAGALLATGNP